MVRADGPRPLAPGCHTPSRVVETAPGAHGQRWVAKRAAGLACFGGFGCTVVFRVCPLCSAGLSPLCMLWVVSVGMGPRIAVSYVPYVSLLRSIRACIYWYI